MDRLNYFAPYQSKAKHHEDQLTRAFLVVLRYVPLAQASFIEAVREKLGDSRDLLPSYHSSPDSIENIQTQVGKVPIEGVTDLVSIMITDKNWTENLKVGVRERSARYDGIIQFGSVVLTIENKPYSKNIWEGQVSPDLERDTGIRIHEKAVVLYWPDVISSLASLVSRRLLGPSSSELIKDFLAFVQDNFPLLNPYDSLEICGESPELIELRCKDILAKIASVTKSYHCKVRYCIFLETGAVRQIFMRLKAEERVIYLSLYPGDTMSQARDFYSGLNLEKLLALSNKGWKIGQNLHFSFIQRHYHWSESEISVKDYLTYWTNNPDRITQVNRDEKTKFTPYFKELLAHNMITREDVAKLDRLFNQSNRNHIRPCPGLSLDYEWPLDKATALDKRGELVNQVREKILEAFATWGQPFSSH